VASQFLKINKIDIAFDFYKKIIQKIDPNDQVNAIELFINAKEFDKAFTFASQIGPSFDAKAGIRVTSAFYKSSQIKMAIDFYHIVFSKLAIAEKISFANLFFESGDKVTAHQLYIECLGQAQKEDAIFIISRLGSIYYESSNWNEVITAYEKIINFVDTATLKYIG
jgi:tetratricopeptide (TPR) repeat protein